MPTNSSAIFSRAHTWGAADTVLATDLNNEFNNILINLNPSGIGGYSFNVLQMQVQTSPGGIGSESLATTLAGEIERLRFQINAIMGTTYWYQTPAATLAQLNQAIGAGSIGNRVNSGVTMASGAAAFLIPDNTVNQVTLATSTPFIYSIAGVAYTISANITLGALATAAASSATTQCKIADTNITSGQSWTQLLGENGSTINVATMGAGISSQIGKIVGLTNVTSGELFIGRVASTTAIIDCYRGYFQTSSSAFSARANVTNGDVLNILGLSWIYATTAGTLTATSTNPSYQGTAPSAPANGDRWFDTSTNIWRSFDGIMWNDSHSTLIGIAAQNDTKTIGVRAQDFFQVFSPTNTIEIFDSSNDTVYPVRGRYIQESISVNGTLLNFGKSYPFWTGVGSGLIDGTTLSNNLDYYFYVSSLGNCYVSSVAPYARADMLGFYHPYAPYRCVGYGLCTASGGPTFGPLESFFRQDTSSSVYTLTAAVVNFPRPYVVQPTQEYIELDASAAAFTQILPPPEMWKGKRYTFIKTDSTISAATLQAWGLSVLTTTCNLTAGNTNIGSLAANTGLSSGITYWISGTGIPNGATGTWSSGSTATSSIASTITLTGTDITFATGSAINNMFTTTLNTQYEAATLFSDGTNVWVENRKIPSNWTPITLLNSNVFGNNGISAIGSQNSFYRRVGDSMEVRFSLDNLTCVASPGRIVLPSGYTIDLRSIADKRTMVGTYDRQSSNITYYGVGLGSIQGANSGRLGIDVSLNTSMFLSFKAVNGGGTNAYDNFTMNSFITSGDGISGVFIVPIKGWNP